MDRDVDKLSFEECFALAIALWGKTSQMNMLTEECAELIVAINHERRGRTSMNSVIEEIVDVEMMIEEVKTMVDSELYEFWKRLKWKKFKDQLQTGLYNDIH